jgi:hypothetical protein
LTTIAQLRRTIEGLGKNYVVSVLPDFPHLISNPDIVIGASSVLFALFVPKVLELNDPNRLLFRLAISRLGLPNNMASALIVDRSKATDDFLHTMHCHFNSIDFAGDTRSLKKFLRTDPDIRPVLPETRQQAFFRYASFFAESKEGAKGKLQHSDPAKLIREWRQSKEFEPTNLKPWSRTHDPYRVTRSLRVLSSTTHDQTLLAGIKFGQETSPLTKLRPVCILSVQANYVLDNGVPYLVHPTINVLVVDRIPLSQLDPLKPLRAAAFAGWIITQANTTEDVYSATKRARESIERQSK